MKGFTLIEVLITVTILAAVAVVVSVNLFGYYNRQNLNLAVNEIVAILRDAQNSSLAQENTDQWGVHFLNPAAGQGLVQVFHGLSFASGTLASTHNLPAGVWFTDPAPNTSKDVIFSKITGYPNASSSISLALKNTPTASSVITISIFGQVANH